MSIDSYTNLKTELAAWCSNRSDLGDVIDTAIDLFEAWANRKLRMPQMERQAWAAAGEYLPMPDDFLQLRDIQYQGSARLELRYVTPQYADEINPSGASGTPKYYTVMADELRLIPPPDTTTPIYITYWERIPALSDSNTSNWLLEEYPDCYLYGSLLHLRVRTVNPEQASFISQGWQRISTEIMTAGDQRNLGSILQIRRA